MTEQETKDLYQISFKAGSGCHTVHSISFLKKNRLQGNHRVLGRAQNWHEKMNHKTFLLTWAILVRIIRQSQSTHASLDSQDDKMHERQITRDGVYLIRTTMRSTRSWCTTRGVIVLDVVPRQQLFTDATSTCCSGGDRLKQIHKISPKWRWEVDNNVFYCFLVWADAAVASSWLNNTDPTRNLFLNVPGSAQGEIV